MQNQIRLSGHIALDVTFQSYVPQPPIAGVEYRPLKKHRAQEGWFLEYLRVSDGVAEGIPTPLEVRQISISKAVPHRLNAFHIHPKLVQDEFWTVIDGSLAVWLIDCRDGSPTLGAKRKYMLSGEEPGLLIIPSGVAHGYKAGPQGALLIYTMNSQFNPANPNEGRLPWDYFGTDLWEEDRG